MAFKPPSVIQGAPSGPTMTPCGAEPSPSGISLTSPVSGSSRPNLPMCCAVYQTDPSGAGATSWGCEPAGTGYSSSTNGATVSGGGVGEDAAGSVELIPGEANGGAAV